MTCEEYVVGKLNDSEGKIERLQNIIEKLNKDLKKYEDIITTYDEIIRDCGELDIFDSGTSISLRASEGYDKSAYDFIMERNGKFLKSHDYRDNRSEDKK